MYFPTHREKDIENAVVCKDRNGFPKSCLIKTGMFMFCSSSPPVVAAPEFILKLVNKITFTLPNFLSKWVERFEFCT